jgi:predicted hotdog family 3-hydroxylacyl-ACP dehydratase
MALTESITSLVPQRPPFLMVDALTGYGDKFGLSEFVIRDENIFVKDGLLTEPGIVENIAQTAAAHAGYAANFDNKPVKVGYIGAVKNLRIHFLPRVNDTLSTEIRVIHEIFEVTIVQGTCTCDGLPVAECEMKIFIPNQNKPV